MSELLNKRYPGTRPFQDSELDRMLFRGREDEKQRLLHLILAERLVTLFAKSGVGKTSLLNAGVFELLEAQNYFPIRVRMNAPHAQMMESFGAQVQQAAQDKKIDYVAGEQDSLWQFFKTAEFWSAHDQLLTPVLVFDQFEEIFTLDYTPQQREIFFRQLAELVRGSMPDAIKQQQRGSRQARYSDTAQDVKIILSLREDFLANLEEMATEIPSILRNRFRLTALTPEQARRAIEEPAQLENEKLSSQRFQYEERAIEAILHFLNKDHETDEKRLISNRKIWPWETLGYLALWIVLFPFLITIFTSADMIVGALAINWLLVIPIVTLVLAFIRPINPLFAAGISLGMQVLNASMQPLAAFIYTQEVDFWIEESHIVVAPYALVLAGAVAAMCWWRRRRIVKARTMVKTIEKREIEPFQLQLLCQYIEDKILQHQQSGGKDDKIEVTIDDFGGEEGMEQILRAFYNNQVNRVKNKYRRSVRKLCEKGLISATGRRLSLDFEVIADKFKLPEDVLSQLINFRLLRMEPRLGSYYYEISHDTLVKPILDTARFHQRLRIARVSTIVGILLVSLIGIEVISHFEEQRQRELTAKETALRNQEAAFYNNAVNVLRSDTLTIADKIGTLQKNQANLDSIIANNQLITSGVFSPDSAASQWLEDNIARLQAVTENFASLHADSDFVTCKRINNKEADEVSGLFFEGSPVFVWGAVNAPREENLLVRWIDLGGVELASNTITVERSPNYRFWVSKTFQAAQTGLNEVRLYNSQNDLIARRKFTVQSNVGALTEAISAEESNTTANARLYTMRGQAFLDAGDVGRAKSDYLTALRINPKYDVALDKLARLLISSEYNLMENGSFEQPELEKGKWSNVSMIPGWRLVRGRSIEIQNQAVGAAFDGEQLLELDSGGPSSIGQQVATIPGQKYLLIFAFSARPGYGPEDNQLEVLWDGSRIGTFIEDGKSLKNTQWKCYRFPLVAKQEKSVLEFRDLGKPNTVGTLLDAVIVVKDDGQY